jgi:transketolase
MKTHNKDKIRLRYSRSLSELQETAWRLSRQILQMTTEADSGHPSSSLSAIDVLTALYFGGILRFDPERPHWPERDRFILSKRPGAPALYAILAEAGYFDADKLSNLRNLGSPLEGHPNMRALPGVEASTGSLGQGLSIVHRFGPCAGGPRRQAGLPRLRDDW